MNILFSSNRFYPEIGGIETISDILSKYFFSAGHSIRLVTQSDGDATNDNLLFEFPIYRKPSLIQTFFNYIWADVVFQNNIEIRQLWPLLVLRKPLIIVLHTWIRSARGKRNLISILKLFALKLANTVVCVSESVRLDSYRNSVVIENPYCDAAFRILPDVERKNSIVFLGRLVSDKGIDLFLKAYAELNNRDWRVSIIGSGPERLDLEKLCFDLGISGSVDFLGSLQGYDLVRKLNEHQLMVIPSRWREPFGVVALEGLACGCVVLASNGGGLPDAVGHAGLIFKRGDQDDLRNKLSTLLHDPNLVSYLRSQADSHLIKFRADVVCTRYLSLVERYAHSSSHICLL